METPIEFYDALAPLFDVMTDWGARLSHEGPFIRSVLQAQTPNGQPGELRVLDAACGSGGHAVEIARWGCQVTGADISPTMLHLARAKAADAGFEIDFVEAGLASLPDALRRQAPFDVVLCLGNSLPHLLSDEDLKSGLNGIAGVLRPGGILITQNLNYDLRWVKQPRFFAAQGGTLHGRQVLVWRFADYEVAERRIAFHIALFSQTDDGWNVNVHTTPQRPLLRADLLRFLGEAGLSAPECYGDMSLPQIGFDAGSSGDLVVVARRS